MEPQSQELNIDTALKARFTALPRVVQEAITSAHIESHLRALSTKHKLHVDQWQSLENEVMLTLLGIQNAEDLPANIASEVGMEPEAAQEIAESISMEIFEPIRLSLERGLSHPNAQAEVVSSLETARRETLDAALPQDESAAPSAPATSPAAAPSQAPQAPILPGTPPSVPNLPQVPAPTPAPDYASGTPSAARKTIANDPYREPII